VLAIQDTLNFTRERLIQYRLLVTWVVVGVLIATTLSLGLSLYIDTVYSDILTTRLDDPPLAYRYRYLGAWEGNITPDRVQQVTREVEQTTIPNMGIGLVNNSHYQRAGLWSVQQGSTNLGTLGLATLDSRQIAGAIVAGEWPAQPGDADVMPTLISQTLFYTMGLQLNDQIQVRSGNQELTLEVVAIWQPDQMGSDAMFPPSFFDDLLLISASDLQEIVGENSVIDDAAWYQSYNLSQVRTSDVSTLIRNTIANERRLSSVLPGLRTEITPLVNLESFNSEVQQLTQQLFIIIAPIGALVFYFIALVSALIVNRQLGDDLKLRSRGMPRGRLLIIHMLMWIIIAGIGFVISAGVSPELVRLVTRTTTFLQFDGTETTASIVFNTQAIGIALFTALLAVSSGIFTAFRLTHTRMNQLKSATTTSRVPFWQRVYLDWLILGVAIYIYYGFSQRQEGASNNQAFSDPSVFLAPTLFSFALVLIAIRMLPWALRLMLVGIERSRNQWLLMTLREFIRSQQRYRGILIMMAFTLSLTGFTASMASTLDQSLADQIRYQTGAELVVVAATDAQVEQNRRGGSQPTQRVTGYNIPPVSQVANLPGVYAASRVGRFDVSFDITNQQVNGTLLGVDRLSIAAVSHFRDDYAGQSLADIMNLFAQDRTGIVVSQQLADSHNIIVGQEIGIQLQALDNTFDIRSRVLGMVDYFPTLDPQNQAFAIANLDPIFERVGTPLPHDFWIATQPGVDAVTTQDRIAATDFPMLRATIPDLQVRQAKTEPGRQGVFGFLSIGFLSAIVLTLIGTIIQSTAAFQSQSSQLATLQAMGMLQQTVRTYVISLQSLVALSGIAIGTLTGVITTRLYLPLLDFSNKLPPYLVRVAWQDIIWVYLTFALILLVVIVSVTFALSRQQLAAIIRLGDAA